MSKVLPLYELNQLFGDNQEKLGSKEFCTGKQIKSGISNAGASQYLDGKFVEVDTSAMEIPSKHSMMYLWLTNTHLQD